MLFSDIFLITDVDGTLLTDDKRVSKKNMVAIREFTENGGIFTIATGRGVIGARPVVDELKIAAFTVLFNGAAIYDFAAKRFLWRGALPAYAADNVLLTVEHFPTLGVEVMHGEDVYITNTNRKVEEHLTYEIINPTRCPFSEIPPDSWIKAVLIDEPETIDKAAGFFARHCGGDVYLVCSQPGIIEILPRGVNKGTGMQKLLAISELSGRYTVAAGDYDNDIELLRFADLGVAVANAEAGVKAAADLIVADNNSDAIWEIVEHLKIHST